MAPHHGSARSDPPRLADWARPRLVVSSQGAPRGAARAPAAYAARGAEFLSTHEHGAVTLRSHPGGLAAETFRTGRQSAVRAAGPAPP
jgi:competence protein ComEC